MSEEIINRVATSSLVQIELEDYLPKEEVVSYDLAQNLFEGMILREKDFRDFLSSHDWSKYNEKIVAIQCSVDAIIPNWAFMLFASKLKENNSISYYGNVQEVKEHLLIENLKKESCVIFKGKKILVKGCGSFELSPKAFIEVTNLLQEHVSSLMFGEACSSVPVYKSRKK